VRLGEPLPEDPVLGWRPRLMHHLHPAPPLRENAQEQARDLETGKVDITTVRNVSFAGSFRVNRLVDLVGEDWFDSDYFRRYYLQQGTGDAIWAGVPVNRDAEIYFGIQRGTDQPRFSEAERDLVAYTLRGLR